jgi:hypothetical protein
MRTPGGAETARVLAGTFQGVARYAVDPDNAERLWRLSEELLAAAG